MSDLIAKARAAAKRNREETCPDNVDGCEELLDDLADELELLTEALRNAKHHCQRNRSDCRPDERDMI